MSNQDMVIWISGASSGIGAGLAKHNPFPGARLINLDIRPTDGIDTVLFDLTRPETWAAPQASFARELHNPGIRRALFLHCAYAPIGKGVVAQVPQDAYERSLLANLTGSMSLAAAFVRAVRAEHESGLMIMTSGAARHPLLGYSSYGASKAALEHWVRIVQAEMTHRGWGPWVLALRPGLVRTETARAASDLPRELFPLGAAMRRDFDTRGEEVDGVAQRIWACLPPPKGETLIDLAERKTPA
jgi:NAD(P)-dependent dehydrogenase (short-subunit alcohol dehydrogenase family)